MKNSFPMATVSVPGTIEFVDRPLEEPAADQVVIKTKAVSICGSDLHTFKGKHPFAPLPAALGHELAGEVVKTGADVVRFQAGDRVVLEPVIICGGCVFCQKGDYHLCMNISFHHRQGKGAFTPYFVAHQDWVHRLPDVLSYAEGALVEPLAVAAHAVKGADIRLGQSVAVFGAGSVGLMILMLAKKAGAGDVFSVDVQEFRLKKAEALGATKAYSNAEGDVLEAIVNRTDGLGVDTAFEAVGIQHTLVQSLKALRKGGTAIVVGLFAEPELTIPSNIFVQKEISLRGSQGYCRDFQTALKLLESREIDLKPLITHTVPLESLEKGFGFLTDPAEEAIKVVVTFD